MTASSVCTLTSEAVNNGEVWFYIVWQAPRAIPILRF
ncbi:hypothetical protein L916_02234 [Phytophthora nicotianae]|uniref:Uncharacterized protein n=1 Tax=Phytophthora nicotianae TaxID=4792 RepID=W2JP07_PHYNI|nr:hypothetical protein L916_02234 [Phytophthora nicotianae]